MAGELDESLSLLPPELAEKIALEAENAEPFDIYTAAALGNYNCVSDYLHRHVDLNQINIGGWAPLIYAAHVGHDNIVNLLIEQGKADPNIVGRDGTSALIQAASCGNDSIAYFLLQYGCRIDFQDAKGRTALHYAALNGHEAVVRLLLNHQACIDMRDQNKETPLFLAATSGFEIVANTLLKQGADYTVVNREGQSIRQAILATSCPNMAIITLLEQGAQSRGSNSDLSSPSLRSPASLSPRRPSVEFNFPNAVKGQTAADLPLVLPSTCEAEDLRDFLNMLGLEKYIPLFEQQEIDFPTLLTMNEMDLKEIGLTVFGPRRKIARSIAGWHHTHHEPKCSKPKRSEKKKLTNAINRLQDQLPDPGGDDKTLAEEVEALHKRVELLSTSLSKQRTMNTFLEEELKAQRQTVNAFKRTHSSEKQVRFMVSDRRNEEEGRVDDNTNSSNNRVF